MEPYRQLQLDQFGESVDLHLFNDLKGQIQSLSHVIPIIRAWNPGR
jgi:hypothetical protein